MHDLCGTFNFTRPLFHTQIFATTFQSCHLPCALKKKKKEKVVMLSSYGQVCLKVLSLPFFGITFKNYTYTFFWVKLPYSNIYPLSRQKISGRSGHVKISSDCTLVVLAHCLVHSRNSVSNLWIEICFFCDFAN